MALLLGCSSAEQSSPSLPLAAVPTPDPERGVATSEDDRSSATSATTAAVPSREAAPASPPTAAMAPAGSAATAAANDASQAGSGAEVANAGSSGSTAGASIPEAQSAGASAGGKATPSDGSESAPVCSSDVDELKPGTTRETIEVDGLSRTYWLTVPDGYDRAIPAPLLLELHGLGLDGQAMMDPTYSSWASVTARENIVHVRPDGIDSAWNVGPCCTRERTVDDVGFLRAIVERVSGQGCIDRRRVYASGYSMGGGMSHYLACHASDVFAAVAPAAFDLLEENKDECKPSRPITEISFRGTEDPIVYARPHESTPPTQLISGYELPPIHFLGPEGTFEFWAQTNGCTGMPVADAGGCRTYDSCAQGVEVTLCLKEGGGHDPPDAERAWQTLKRFVLPQ